MFNFKEALQTFSFNLLHGVIACCGSDCACTQRRISTKQNNRKAEIKLVFLFIRLLTSSGKQQNTRSFSLFKADKNRYNVILTLFSFSRLSGIIEWSDDTRTEAKEQISTACSNCFVAYSVEDSSLFHICPPETDPPQYRSILCFLLGFFGINSFVGISVLRPSSVLNVNWLISLGSLWLSERGRASLLHVNATCF